MRIFAFSALALGFGLTVVQLTACSNSSDDCNATATCGATAGSSHAGSAGKSGGGDGSDGGANNGGTSNVAGSSNMGGTSGAQGGGGEGGGNGACTGDVADDAACWTTNELGVFVSSDAGDDTAGDGTKEAPYKTITKGIAAAAGKNVYVCVGTADYAEKISLDAASDGIHIYGGFECSTWTYATTRSAQVLSPSNIALRIDGLKKGATIENVGFKAADATGAGADASSYGAFVTGSKGVVLTRVELLAGAGMKGADGAPGTVTPDAASAGAAQNGQPALCEGTLSDVSGGSWDEPVCGSRGGAGGKANVGTAGSDGVSGTPGEDVDPPTAVNRGLGASVVGADGQPGTKGSKGNPGSPGSSANVAGAFTMGGYSTADGHAGSSGFPGQGGGGGGASASKSAAGCRGASGGAGGLGGCGGKPGGFGQGGGASVGIFTWSSPITLIKCNISSGTGGAGGAGGKAGGGGSGGSGGLAGLGNALNSIGLSGQGGFGGNGGPGGNGSGGTGGPSYALVYFGTQPAYDVADTKLVAGTPGAAGVGGQQVSTVQAQNGSVGAAATEFLVP